MDDWAAISQSLQELLDSLCLTISNELGIEDDVIGGRIWLLPEAVAASLTGRDTGSRLSEVTLGAQRFFQILGLLQPHRMVNILSLIHI